jgi:predicted RNA-binding Zn-ribbon protein involved in translation (DUF1610 family)
MQQNNEKPAPTFPCPECGKARLHDEEIDESPS